MWNKEIVLRDFLVFFFFLKYNRNSNLDSHTRIFWRSRGLNPHPHREGFFEEGITTGPNTQVAEIFWFNKVQFDLFSCSAIRFYFTFNDIAITQKIKWYHTIEIYEWLGFPPTSEWLAYCYRQLVRKWDLARNI